MKIPELVFWEFLFFLWLGKRRLNYIWIGPSAVVGKVILQIFFKPDINGLKKERTECNIILSSQYKLGTPTFSDFPHATKTKSTKSILNSIMYCELTDLLYSYFFDIYSLFHLWQGKLERTLTFRPEMTRLVVTVINGGYHFGLVPSTSEAFQLTPFSGRQ